MVGASHPLRGGVINMKTAKALVVSVPPAPLAQATKIIQ